MCFKHKGTVHIAWQKEAGGAMLGPLAAGHAVFLT